MKVSKMTWFEILKVNKANGMSARGFRGGDRRKPRRGWSVESGSLQDKKTKCLEEWEKHRSLAKYEECMEKAKR